jgi:hypothetical protein
MRQGLRVLKACMPAITYPRLPLTVEDVVSFWGPRRARLASARMKALLSDLLERIEAGHWIEPRIGFEVWPVVGQGQDWLDLRGGTRISSPRLSHHLPGATHVAAGVCTIGDAVEKHASEGFAASDRLRAVLLDDIGTLVLFRVADQLEELMQAEAARYGLEAGGVLNPGEDGFQISQQTVVVELAGGTNLGVSQTATGMLVPRKSLSMVVGFGARMPKWSRGERCERCGARERCPHRRSRMVEVAM